MATAVDTAPVVEAHRVAQARIAAGLTQQLLDIWPLLDLTDLDRTLVRWLDVAQTLVAVSYDESAQLGLAFYDELRHAAGAGRIGLAGPPPMSVERLRTSLTVMGPVALRRGQDPDTARAGAAAAGTRQGLAGGRDSITTAMGADPDVVGYRRSVAPMCCAFCAMLASRGAVYSARSVRFRAHDRCMCQPEPVWQRTPPSPDERALRDLWDRSADMAEFRRLLDASRA